MSIGQGMDTLELVHEEICVSVQNMPPTWVDPHRTAHPVLAWCQHDADWHDIAAPYQPTIHFGAVLLTCSIA